MARIAKELYEQQVRWMDAINRAIAVRKDWKDRFRVDLARDYLDGKQNPGYPENEWITINKVYSHLKAKLPALYSADPYFYVRLKRAFNPDPQAIVAYEQKGKLRAAMLNYYKEELDLKTKARVAIQDSQFAYGVVKVHYHADQQKNPDGGEPIMSEGDESSPLIDPETSQPMLEPDYIPVNERYCITRIHPDDFLWDEDSGPLEDDWHWLAQRIRMPLDEAKRNPIFSKKALKSLEGRGSAGMDDEQKDRQRRKKGDSLADQGDIKGVSERSTSGAKDSSERTIVQMYEIYNIKRKTWLVIADGAEVPLIEEQTQPPGIDKHPFAILRFTLRDDSPYPIPPMSQGIDPAKEYNLARSRIMVHRKRFNRKYQVLTQGLIDDTELTKLEVGDDGTCIRVQTIPAIAPIADAPLDQMSYMELQALNSDMTELFGGEFGEARGIAQADSATQAGILDKRLEMREGDDISMVVDWVRVIARKLDQLIKVHIQADEAVRVAGPEGVAWELVRQSDYEDIAGEFGYDVNVGATMPRLPQMERASWQAFLAMISNAPWLALSPRLLKVTAENHHIEDDRMVEEIQQIAQKLMSGQMQPPAPTGSQPGVSESRPVSAIGGQAGGPMSLAMPGAGNIQG